LEAVNTDAKRPTEKAGGLAISSKIMAGSQGSKDFFLKDEKII